MTMVDGIIPMIQQQRNAAMGLSTKKDMINPMNVVSS